jgi:hypothetical protein
MSPSLDVENDTCFIGVRFFEEGVDLRSNLCNLIINLIRSKYTVIIIFDYYLGPEDLIFLLKHTPLILGFCQEENNIAILNDLRLSLISFFVVYIQNLRVINP